MHFNSWFVAVLIYRYSKTSKAERHLTDCVLFVTSTLFLHCDRFRFEVIGGIHVN
jgi:hypothetical protein